MDAPVRVLFMQTQSNFGADSRIHAMIMQNLDPRRVECHVACTPEGDGASAFAQMQRLPHVRVLPIDFGPTGKGPTLQASLAHAAQHAGFLFDLARLAAYARKHRIDIVHGTEKLREVLFGTLVARAAGAKLVTHMHVKMADWIRPLARRLIQQSDALLGVSDWVCDTAVEMGYPRDRMHSVLNAIEFSDWDPRESDGAAIRREFALDASMPVLAIIARVIPWKGHALLLRALARVRAAGLDFRLLVVGKDDNHAVGGAGHTSELRELVRELDLESQVIFTGWRTDVHEMLAAIDIFALPSFEEPFGVAYLEAMAMEKPVVALRSGGVVEFIEHDVTGMLSAPDDVEQLAANLEQLIRDDELRRRLGLAGREHVRAHFDAPRLAADMETFYRRVAEGA